MSGQPKGRTAGTTGSLLAAIAAVALPAGCSAEAHARRADRAVYRTLDREMEVVLGGREASVRQPELLPLEEPPGPGEVDPGETPDALVDEPTRILGLREALSLAVESNRDYVSRREALYLEALSYTQTRHDFTPQLRATLGYLFSNFSGPGYVNDGDFAVSLTQILPLGGSVAVGLDSGVLDDEVIAPEYDSGVSISLVQPLLRGFGHEVTHDRLIQAERNLVYEIRAFELFREDFTIDVARRFYDLVQQKQTIENTRLNLESFVFGTLQAEALFKVGRSSELDVLRARRNELTARNSFISAEENYQLALDRFRIFLGLPPHVEIDVEGDPPPFTETRFEVASAVSVALDNRLDLITRRQQLEDVERALRVARNGLLPDLDLAASTGFSSTLGDDPLGTGGLGFDSFTVGVTLDLPLDRVDERSAYRRAQIALARARRDLEEFTDNLVVEIQSAFRELERRLQSLAIQRQLIGDQSKNVKIAELRFERGEIPNRDVVEANQSLLDAQNALINEQVQYEIARLELLRNLGILFIDDEGMWK